MQVNRRHPLFTSKYGGIKHKLTVRLQSTCHFFVHQEALLDVVNVITALLKDTGLLADIAATAAAASSSAADGRAKSASQRAKAAVSEARDRRKRAYCRVCLAFIQAAITSSDGQ